MMMDVSWRTGNFGTGKWAIPWIADMESKGLELDHNIIDSWSKEP